MADYNDYLQNEADYQDLKITQNPRADLSAYYNDEASKYRAECCKAAIGDLNGKRVLDLGCGNGAASMNALRAGAYVTAIDISPKSIEYLIETAKREKLDDRLEAFVWMPTILSLMTVSLMLCSATVFFIISRTCRLLCRRSAEF